MLPIHPQPQQDELRSSWMVRLAFANGFFAHSFYSYVLNCPFPIWTRDIDRHPPQGLFDVLSAATGQNESVLRQLTLEAYQGHLFDSLVVSGNSRWVLPVGVHHRERTSPGLQFCPKCLSEDKAPYFRRKWRLALFALCEKHGCLLLDRCPNCGAFISYHRHGVKNRSISIPTLGIEFCWSCQFDLRLSPSLFPRELRSDLVSRYLRLLKDFEKGPACLNKIRFPMAISFYNGIWCIASAILGHRGGGMRYKLSKELDVGLDILSSSSKSSGVEYLSIFDRLVLMISILWLIAFWPQRLVKMAKNSRLSISSFSDHSSELPYWLGHVVNDYLTHKVYIPSLEESISVGNYIQSTKEDVRVEDFMDVLDVSKGVARSELLTWKEHRGD